MISHIQIRPLDSFVQKYGISIMFYNRQLLTLVLISHSILAMDMPNLREIEQYYGASKREMDAVFASAPEKAQRIVGQIIQDNTPAQQNNVQPSSSGCAIQ